MSWEKTPLKGCPYHTTKKGIINITKFLGKLASRIENNPKKELLKLLLVDIANLQKFEWIAKKYNIPSAINTKELFENLAHSEWLPAWLRKAGAMMAWLNTGRCPWRWFAVWWLDHREVLNANITHQEVFDAIESNISYALSGTAMTKQAITLFPSHVKIHNPIIVSFAGYEGGIWQQNNIALTQECIKAWWQPKDSKNNFTILPLLIEINGERQYFEFPPDITKTIPIISDKHLKLEELWLQRSQVPGQSVTLHLWPEQFTAVINWPRIVAEIINMNLLNKERFGLRKQISEVLWTTKERYPQTWEIETKTCLLEAVCYSYKKARWKLIIDTTIDSSVVWFHNLLEDSLLSEEIHEDRAFAIGAMLDPYNSKSYHNKALFSKMYKEVARKWAYFSF